MRTFSGRRSTLALAIIAVTATPGRVVVPRVSATGFIDDLTLAGGIYYWQRERDCKDITDGDRYKVNPPHSTWNASLDFQPGCAADMFGPDTAAFTAIEMAENDDSGHPDEVASSSRNKAYDGGHSDDESSISLYKAAMKFKYDPAWVRAGYIQPTGQTLLAPHQSFMPGIYQGAEAGANSDYGTAGALGFSYMWTNEYKAPQHIKIDDFYQNDRKTKVDYLHSVGARYDLENDLVLKAASGQVQSYIDQYLTKASYKFDVVGVPLSTSYQFYGTRDRINSDGVDGIYDGTAWLQALTFGYKVVDVLGLRLEDTWVETDGQQGYLLQRMAPAYASFNGCLDAQWDDRSDFNANGEKMVFFGVMYGMKDWDIPGWAFGASYVYAWDVESGRMSSPDAYYNPDYRLKGSAYSLDALHTVQEDRAEGTLFKPHFTQYNNHFDIPSWSSGYGNIFQDERDVEFMVITPFTIF